MSSLKRLNNPGTTNRPVKLEGAEDEPPLVIAAGQAQTNSNRNRILARIQGPPKSASSDFCDVVYSLLAFRWHFVKYEIGQCYKDGAE
jgi:hypothetical protein